MCLVQGAADLTAIDASPETIEINRSKIGNAPVQYVVADLFEWWPTEKYDFVFFGFWLSHVPAQQFNRLWEMVRAALKPGGRAFFVDGLATQETTARDHAAIDDSGVMERKLNDGRIFNIVKVFHDPPSWNGNCAILVGADQLERAESSFITVAWCRQKLANCLRKFTGLNNDFRSCDIGR